MQPERYTDEWWNLVIEFIDFFSLLFVYLACNWCEDRYRLLCLFRLLPKWSKYVSMFELCLTQNIIILLTKAQKNTPVVDTCLGILKQEHLIEHRPNLPGELVRFNHIVESGFVSDLINLLLKVINNVILFLTKHHCTACLSHREGTT